ncbi:transcriptional regulator, MarR family [Frankineae bacterium MT45]|nr:transcriptional regulator, MarR family [Frankineae bacterium MT45]
MGDEVDEIVDAWRHERPELDLSPLQILSRVSRLADVLDERRTAAFVEHGLQTHEFDVLSALRRSGGEFEMTAGELCIATHVTSGTMTSRLDRLVARKLVIRRPDPGDGRLVQVRLTSLGRRRVDAAFEALLESEKGLIEDITESRQEELAAALRDLLAATDR